MQTLSQCLLMHNDESIITPRLRANSDGSMTDWAICIVGGEIFFAKRDLKNKISVFESFKASLFDNAQDLTS